MCRTRVLEIIAAYGADATRWPVAERETVQKLLARDAGLQAELARAAALDAELSAWAQAPIPWSDLDATTAADAAFAKAQPLYRWWPTAVLGGSVAAALVAAIAILPPRADRPPTDRTPVAQAVAPVVLTAEAERDVQLWASVFTLTPEEETLI